jgi:hypothetical protein
MFKSGTLKVVASITILVLVTLMQVSTPIVVGSGIREVLATSTFHYVTVASNGKGFDISITPLNLSAKPICTTCSCPVAGTTQSVNASTVILFQNSTYILIKRIVSYGNTLVEIVVSGKLLWQWTKSDEKENRSAYLYQVEIASANTTLHYYMLTYSVRALDYNLTIATQLIPANESFYNYSFTYVVYVPKEKRVVSLEIVKFNTSVTLSQLYQALSRVAKELRHIYQTSSNTTIRSLKDGYLTIEKELNNLARLVEKELPQYNKPVIYSIAIINDDWFSCSLCNLLAGAVCMLLGQMAVSAVCPTACAMVCAIFVAQWWLAMICGVVCGPTCSALVQAIIQIGVYTACQLGGIILCSYIGACP